MRGVRNFSKGSFPPPTRKKKGKEKKKKKKKKKGNKKQEARKLEKERNENKNVNKPTRDAWLWGVCVVAEMSLPSGWVTAPRFQRDSGDGREETMVFLRFCTRRPSSLAHASRNLFLPSRSFGSAHFL
mmetsp:Transcript_6166/g.15210  ORF Transcript_6166/g.15210 Transcript_6166/m.15210 type:complete len:128 (-) Transcript_6166:1910-2293(-)